MVGGSIGGFGTLWNTIGGGHANQNLSLWFSTIAGGDENTIKAEAEAGSIGGGSQNKITNGAAGTIGGGIGNIISASLGTIPGGAGANASSFGQLAYAAGGFNSGSGNAQMSYYVLRRTTSSSATNELFLDETSLRPNMPTNSTWTFEVQVAARGGNNSAGFLLNGVVENVSGTASVLALNKTVITRDVGSWDATLSTTNGNVIIQVNGDNTSVRWVATIRTTEVTN